MARSEYAATGVIAVPRRGFRKRSEAVLGRDWIAGWAFFAPTFILLFVLVGWPFVNGLYISFTRTIGATVEIGPFIGLQNYIDLVHDPDFWYSLGITVQFTFWAEVFKPILGIIAALILHNIKRYRTVFSAMILLPWIVPAIVQALIWRALYDPIFGPINYLLSFLHLSDEGFAGLGDVHTALWAVIIVNVWAGIPFFTITQLAGLKSIDPELYAASAVDGANAWQRFRYITLPGIQYTLVVASLLSTVWTMNNFNTIYLLTSGGPEDATRVVGILSFQRAFASFDFGSGAAIALVLLPLFGVIIWILSAYMSSTGAEKTGDSIQLRLLRPIVRPVGKLFSLLFDGGEGLFRIMGYGIRTITRRPTSEPTMGARTAKMTLRILSGLVLAALLTFELLPFYWVVTSAFKTDVQISSMASPFWPQPFSLDQATTLLTRTDFLSWYRNTIQVAIIAVAIGVLGSAAGAYSLARLRWRGSGFMSTLMLLSYMMPGAVMLVPFYHIMVTLHLINTLQALELLYPSFLLPFATWLLMGYYRSIPEELEDAARIDGASWLRIFWHVAVPLGAAGMVVVAIFTFVGAWGDFLVTLTMIDQDKWMTISVGIRKLLTTGTVAPFFAGSQLTGKFATYGTDCALLLASAAPAVVVYIVLQRWFVRGLTEGIMKF